MNILVSGCAGFIGYHLSNYLCNKYSKIKVFGFDNLNNFYSIEHKNKRMQNLKKNSNVFFKKIDLCEKKKLELFIKKNKINIVFHIAAQAGVRDSLKMPETYYKSNFEGFLNIIGLSKKYRVKKFIFASSSSVYGDKKKFPLNENMKIIPKNIYAATKKVNEEIARDISLISDMSIIGLRFFTVYGKYGRPDMFIFKYLKSLFNKKKFELYNHGKNYRDYTHIDDVVRIIDKLREKKLKKKFEIFNICSSQPIDIQKLSVFISKFLNKKSQIVLRKRNKIEVIKTHGNNKKILQFLNCKIEKKIYFELPKIINWYKQNNIWRI